MVRPLVFLLWSWMAARPMAPTVSGAPPGGVVGLSLSFPLGYQYTFVLVGGAGATGVDWLIEAGHFCFQVLEFPLEVSHGRLQRQVLRLLGGEEVGVQRHFFSQGAVSCCRLVTAARSSAVSCDRSANTTDISMALLAVTAWYPPWREVFWRSCRLACALMKFAWNLVQVFSWSDLDLQVRQSSCNFPLPATRL